MSTFLSRNRPSPKHYYGRAYGSYQDQICLGKILEYIGFSVREWVLVTMVPHNGASRPNPFVLLENSHHEKPLCSIPGTRYQVLPARLERTSCFPCVVILTNYCQIGEHHGIVFALLLDLLFRVICVVVSFPPLICPAQYLDQPMLPKMSS